jgi:hypothetical protein
VFDNTAQPYNATAIITNNQFDVEKYHSYSPPFISTTQQIAYGLKFATFTAVIVHTFRMSDCPLLIDRLILNNTLFSLVSKRYCPTLQQQS